MANYFKAVLTFNNENLGKAVNVYYMEDSLGISSDTAIRFQMNAYLEAIYGPLQEFMSEGIMLMDCPVYEVDGTGATIRSLGTIAPDVEGASINDNLALPTAGSMMARTGIPRVQGRKRLPGFVESAQADGLFQNALLNALAQAALVYILGLTGWPEISYFPGVPSSKTASWQRFEGTGTVTNIPGTQVTRKPGRGA